MPPPVSRVAHQGRFCAQTGLVMRKIATAKNADRASAFPLGDVEHLKPRGIPKDRAMHACFSSA